MHTTHSFAILASVPEMHLESGVETINKLHLESNDKVKVAFGSMDFEVFRKADQLRGDQVVEVFIYASQAQSDQPLHSEVTWSGLYINHVNSRNGRYPGKKEFRPASTLSDAPRWAVFWEVQDLKLLKTPIKIASLKGMGKKSHFTSRFIPETPLLIEYL